MKNKFIISLLALGITASPMLTFAETGATGSSSTAPVTTASKVDPACMISAVDARDTSLISAVDARDTALKAALTARKSALDAAWNLTGKARTAALKKAWKDYRSAVATARKAYLSAYKAAWAKFYKDRKACGKGAAGADVNDSAADASI